MYGFAGYDHWKTTPPDYWYTEAPELTPEQEAEEAFDEWFGLWLSDLWDDGYEASLDMQAECAKPLGEVAA